MHICFGYARMGKAYSLFSLRPSSATFADGGPDLALFEQAIPQAIEESLEGLQRVASRPRLFRRIESGVLTANAFEARWADRPRGSASATPVGVARYRTPHKT